MKKRLAGSICAAFSVCATAWAGDVPTAPALLSGIDTQYNDRTVRPQDDFYRYVNGRWRDAKPDEFARRRSTSAPRPR